MSTQANGECGVASLSFISLFMKEYDQLTKENISKFAEAHAHQVFSVEEIDKAREDFLYIPAVKYIVLDVEEEFDIEEKRKEVSYSRLAKNFVTSSIEGRFDVFKSTYVDNKKISWELFKEGLLQFLGETFLPTYNWLDAQHLKFAESALNVRIKFFREVKEDPCLLEYYPYADRCDTGTFYLQVYKQYDVY